MSPAEKAFSEEEEVERLKGVCRYERYQNHGSFLKAFLEAFVHADAANSRILLPAMQALEKKYSLQDLSVLTS